MFLGKISSAPVPADIQTTRAFLREQKSQKRKAVCFKLKYHGKELKYHWQRKKSITSREKILLAEKVLREEKSTTGRIIISLAE